MQTESVSVVIPVKDRPTELRKAIKSALAQNLSPCEVIVVENNSRSPEKVREACEDIEDGRIKFHSLIDCANGSVARNFGSRLASGKWKIGRHTSELQSRGH